MRRWWMLLPFVAACGVERMPAEPLPPSPLDATSFEVRVWPMLDRSCAQPSCHGNADTRYRLYTQRGMRLGASSLARDALSAEELAANHQATWEWAAGLEDPLDSLLLSKPLRRAAGGLTHEGGEIFHDKGDPSYVLLACWLTGGGKEGAPRCWP